MNLCIATNNSHKMEEFKSLFPTSIKLVTLAEIGCHEDIPENEATIEGNSAAKVRYVWEKYGVNCMADDSGLEVDALNGEPGVHSARYAGEQRSHEDNINKLLTKLQGVNTRGAQFKAVISLLTNGEIIQFTGICRGKIIHEKRGRGGFGYDPIFIPEGYDQTFAEMSMEEKNPISHRGKSVELLLDYLND
jgi:XTP/dITP diphosphohydrolase